MFRLSPKNQSELVITSYDDLDIQTSILIRKIYDLKTDLKDKEIESKFFRLDNSLKITEKQITEKIEENKKVLEKMKNNYKNNLKDILTLMTLFLACFH